MCATKRQCRGANRLTVRHVISTWTVAIAILLVGVVQSGGAAALLGGWGISGTSLIRASTDVSVFPGGNIIQICTPAGIETITLGDTAIDASGRDPSQSQTVGHGFCSLCASHHGAVVALNQPDATVVEISRDVVYRAVTVTTTAHEIPRLRHPRAPPVII
ncbi:hypothetical protein LPB41_21665 [Thalassospira sp. MA62]|nr:hypothetical protein [Thalassospira sp. MA62]